MSEEIITPEETGVATAETEELAPSTDEHTGNNDEAGVVTKPDAEGKEDKTDPAIKLEMKKERDRRREAEKDALYYRGLAEGRADKKPEDEPVTSTVAAAPVEEDYEDFQEYLTEVAKYSGRQAVKEATEAAKVSTAAETAKTTQENIDLAHNERMGEAQDRYPDFDEVVMQNKALSINKAMFDVIKESEQGPDLAHYLGKHPEEAAKIAVLSPLGAARALGRIEAGLTPPSKPKANTKSGAPEPITTNSGSGEPMPEALSDDMPIGDWMKKRRADKRARAQAG
jgi:hypothetical protein